MWLRFSSSKTNRACREAATYLDDYIRGEQVAGKGNHVRERIQRVACERPGMLHCPGRIGLDYALTNVPVSASCASAKTLCNTHSNLSARLGSNAS